MRGSAKAQIVGVTGSLAVLIFILSYNTSWAVNRELTDAELRQLAPTALEVTDLPDNSHLSAYVRDPNWAVVLGKALFWDSAVGSDGLACASCHFKAGADSRSKNQISPGLLNTTPGVDPRVFGPMLTGSGGPNYQLTADDFPLPKTINGVVRDDVVSSHGVFMGNLTHVSLLSSADNCSTTTDFFQVGGVNVRRVEPRNTPTVINAAFNYRNFWDGRANNIFNGLDPLGHRSNLNNPTQGIWVYNSVSRTKSKAPVEIKNSSLASQAVGPALSDFEMSCASRTFPQLGKKMLGRRALEIQTVHPQDSAFGTGSAVGNLVHTSGKGLTLTYSQIIRKAFHSKYWMAPGTVENGFTQMEANFSLFWGLAIQAYERTLVSHQTRFDDFARGNNAALTETEKLGLEVFVRQDRGRCINCHGGPEFTNAAFRNVVVEPMERMRMGNGGVAVYDNGFYNIGVRATLHDLGIGADLAGFPLSFAGQASTGVIADAEANGAATAEDGDPAISSGLVQLGERTAIRGAVKTPTLRNVELTAPYFSDGSHHTLVQVARSYKAQMRHLFAEENIADLDPDIMGIDIEGFTADGAQIRGGEIDALAAFMKALTDERVRYDRAPFDHPELSIPNGYPVDHTLVTDANGDGKGDDVFMIIPATGASGLTTPIPGFLE